MNDVLSEEVAILREIFEELEVDEQSSERDAILTVCKKVRPNDEGQLMSSASVRLELTICNGYPDVSPVVRVREPRGISGDAVSRLEKSIDVRLEEQRGSAVIFEIIQLASDFLASNQESDSLTCSICLLLLSESPVKRTECDHYYHVQCLEEYFIHTRTEMGLLDLSKPHHLKSTVEKVLRCPECRFVLHEDVEPIYPEPPPKSKARRHRKRSDESRPCPEPKPKFTASEKENFDFDWKQWRETQKKLCVIFEKQKLKGGIIDEEEERKKDLISEDTVVFLADDVAQHLHLASTSAPEVPNDQANTIPAGVVNERLISSSSDRTSSFRGRHPQSRHRGHHGLGGGRGLHSQDFRRDDSQRGAYGRRGGRGSYQTRGGEQRPDVASADPSADRLPTGNRDVRPKRGECRVFGRDPARSGHPTRGTSGSSEKSRISAEGGVVTLKDSPESVGVNASHGQRTSPIVGDPTHPTTLPRGGRDMGRGRGQSFRGDGGPRGGQRGPFVRRNSNGENRSVSVPHPTGRGGRGSGRTRRGGRGSGRGDNAFTKTVLSAATQLFDVPPGFAPISQ